MKNNSDNPNQPTTAVDAVLSIDLGTSSCKCAIVSLDGRILAWDSAPIDIQIIGHDGAEQIPADWWQAFCIAAKSVSRAARERSHKIIAICASAQAEGTVAVDGNGEPLYPALLWLDMRGRDAIRRNAGSGLFRVAGYNVRKLTRWIRLTGGAPALSGKDPAAHMLFIKEHLPEVYGRADKFLNVLDYLNFRLTGRMVATPDSILTSWVTDNRDPANVAYHAGLIRALGVDAKKLPDIVASTHVIGAITDSVALELGVPAGTPVVAGSIDTSAAAIGSGAVRDGQAHLYVGTSSWIGAHVPEKRTHIRTQIASVPCARPDKYLMTALQSAAGANLSFLRDRVFFNRDERLQYEESLDVAGRCLHRPAQRRQSDCRRAKAVGRERAARTDAAVAARL